MLFALNVVLSLRPRGVLSASALITFVPNLWALNLVFQLPRSAAPQVKSEKPVKPKAKAKAKVAPQKREPPATPASARAKKAKK